MAVKAQPHGFNKDTSYLTSVPEKLKIDWFLAAPWILFHVLTLAALFWAEFSLKWGLVAVSSYYLRMFGITAGYHRFFSHRTYHMARIPQFLMAFLGCSATQKGPLWWAAHHRHHHRFSDTKDDLHSPLQKGFWYSHVGWIMANKNDATRWELVRDLSRYPELRWLNRFHLVPAIVYATFCFYLGSWNGLFWGYFFPTLLLWHGVFFINSLCHVWGYRTYKTTDTSRNNFVLAILTLGEGWHNNHHCYMNSVNQGFKWWQFDGSFYVLKFLSFFGIVSDLKMAPVEQLEKKRI